MTNTIKNLPSRPDPVLRVVPRPADINANGHIFGGWVLSQMDIAGGIVATRISQGPTATVAIDAMEFIAPILMRDIISVYAHLERRALDYPGIQARVDAMVMLGVPYGEAVTRAPEMARAQAVTMAAGIVASGGPRGLEDREVIALIAYLQRLGRDIQTPGVPTVATTPGGTP